MVRPLALILLALLGACGGGAVPEPPPPTQMTMPDAEPFDRDESGALLHEGRKTAEFDLAAAEPLYRAAGLSWPDHREAWQRLAEAAWARGDRVEAEAAEFMVDRLRLYPSEELYVQRQVNAALKTYLEEQRALPGHNPATQTYGARLALFYDALLAERPAYSAPTGIFNLAPHEVPTAIITGGAGYIYFSTMGGG